MSIPQAGVQQRVLIFRKEIGEQRFARLETDTRSRPAGFTGRAVAAQKWKRPERADPPGSSAIDQQKLSPPDRAVVAVTGAIPRDPQNRPALAVLGQARGYVGVVMLDGHHRQFTLPGKPRRKVVGMAVANDSLGRDAEELAKVGDGLAIAPAGRGCCQVADVLAQENLPVPGQGNRRFEMAARRQKRRQGARHCKPHRRQPPANSDRYSPPADQPHDGVVGMPHDRAIVH